MTQFFDGLNPSPPDPHRGATGPRDPRAWLDAFPAPRRPTVSNWFHYAVRNGATTLAAVCSAVWQTVQQRLQWSSDLTKRQFLQGVLEVLRTHQAEALLYAQSVITYEALPYEQRQQAKAQRSFAYLTASMQGKPATEPQHRELRRLGYTGELPGDRANASQLIDQLRQRKGGAQ